MKLSKIKTEIRNDLTNKEYHSMPNVFSSSNLKVALEDMELFYKESVLKQKEEVEVAAFDTGTYFHTRVLEPHLLEEECAVYDGVKRGTKWETFKALNKGKAIVNLTQRDTAEKLAGLVFESPCAMKLIEKGTPEVSAFCTIFVDTYAGRIYSSDLNYVLESSGWRYLDFTEEVQLSSFTVPLNLKVRADVLIESEGAILDLKSTSGNAKSVYHTKKKISSYEYDLSASLYLDVFTLATDKKFDKFYWTFASKDKLNCKTYLASKTNIEVGRAKWVKAAFNIAEAILGDWTFEDTIDELEPESYLVLDWLKEKK